MFLSPAFADKFQINYSCWPQEIQAEFKKHDIKLDLDGSERTDDSWGYILNEGSSYTILTYKSATPEQMKLMIDIAGKIELEKREK